MSTENNPTYFKVVAKIGRSPAIGAPLNQSSIICDKKETLNIFPFLGIKKAVSITETAPFKKLNTTLVPNTVCSSKYKFKSDSYYDCFLRAAGTTGPHSVGTCRMGFGANDTNSVLDSKLR